MVIKLSFFSVLVLSSATPAQSLLNYSVNIDGDVAGHPAAVFNPEGDHVLIVYHGIGPPPHYEDYYDLANEYAGQGYCVVVPQDCEGSNTYEIAYANHWGYTVARDVVNKYANGRPVAILGHSLGGAAAINAAKRVSGLAAHVIMHTAHLSPEIFVSCEAPTLFTTGTADDGAILGFTLPKWTKDAYDEAKSPKALVNVKGNIHTSPQMKPGFGGREFEAATNWLDCYARKSSSACNWLKSTLCNDGSLEWCELSGVSVNGSSILV